MKGMTTLWDNVRLLTREPEAKTEWFQADWALFLVFCRIMAGDDRKRSGMHGSVGMGVVVFAGGSGGGRCRIGRVQRGCSGLFRRAKDRVKGLERRLWKGARWFRSTSRGGVSWGERDLMGIDVIGRSG